MYKKHDFRYIEIHQYYCTQFNLYGNYKQSFNTELNIIRALNNGYRVEIIDTTLEKYSIQNVKIKSFNC